MRRDEEVVDAGIALGVFVVLCMLYCCASRWQRRQRGCCCCCCTCSCANMFDCLGCCRDCNPIRVPSYNDLEELLFDVEAGQMGRLRHDCCTRGEDPVGQDISVGNFFCDVLKTPAPLQRLSAQSTGRAGQSQDNDDGDDDDDDYGVLNSNQNSRFEEPLL